jgi:hypothetical protein
LKNPAIEATRRLTEIQAKAQSRGDVDSIQNLRLFIGRAHGLALQRLRGAADGEGRRCRGQKRLRREGADVAGQEQQILGSAGAEVLSNWIPGQMDRLLLRCGTTVVPSPKTKGRGHLANADTHDRAAVYQI